MRLGRLREDGNHGGTLFDNDCQAYINTTKEQGEIRINFTPQIASVLRDASRKMRAITGKNHQLYNYLHITMSKLWPVDSFYVGFFQAGNVVTFPYNFDNNRYRDPNFHIYGKNGMCAWIIKHRRPYTFGLDQGALLRRGYSFGEVELKSRDAVVIPLVARNGRTRRVVGKAAIQSYRPGVYNTDTVAAFWWLGQAMTTVLTHQKEERRDDLGHARSQVSAETMSLPELVDRVGGKLQALREGIDGIRQIVPYDDLDLRRAVLNVGEICETVQTETFELLVQPAESSTKLLAELTPREREVAELVAQGHSNKEVARRMYITELTAKTHVSRILRKFGVGQRSEIAATMRSLSDLREIGQRSHDTQCG